MAQDAFLQQGNQYCAITEMQCNLQSLALPGMNVNTLIISVDLVHYGNFKTSAFVNVAHNFHFDNCENYTLSLYHSVLLKSIPVG